MGRLIDEDVVWRKLQYRLKKYGNKHMSEKFKEMLDSVPTAYDVEKVVTEIQKEYCKKCRNILSVPNANEYCKSVNCDIGIMCDIVKRGGVE